MNILVMTTRNDTRFKNMMSFQPLYNFEKALNRNKGHRTTFLHYPQHPISFSKWLQCNGHESESFDIILFFVLSSRHASETTVNLLEIAKVKTSKIMYIIDYWDYDQLSIDEIILDISPQYIFYSYFDVGSIIRQKFNVPCFWLPLAEDDQTFTYNEEKKTAHFIQFGRKNKCDYEFICQLCRNEGWHLTDLTRSPTLFEKFNPFSFYNQKASTDYFSRLLRKHLFGLVSFSSKENNHLIGAISPITPRYYQIMFSGAIPVGQFPAGEMRRLFADKLHVLKLDNMNVEKSIKKYVYDISMHSSHVKENISYLKKNHTWNQRTHVFFDCLKSEKNYYSID